MGHQTVVMPSWLLNLTDLHLHRLAQALIKCAHRFVHQQQPRFEHDGPSERDALLLAAGQLLRIATLEPVEPHRDSAATRDGLSRLAIRRICSG